MGLGSAPLAQPPENAAAHRILDGVQRVKGLDAGVAARQQIHGRNCISFLRNLVTGLMMNKTVEAFAVLRGPDGDLYELPGEGRCTGQLMTDFRFQCPYPQSLNIPLAADEKYLGHLRLLRNPDLVFNVATLYILTSLPLADSQLRCFSSDGTASIKDLGSRRGSFDFWIFWTYPPIEAIESAPEEANFTRGNGTFLNDHRVTAQGPQSLEVRTALVMKSGDKVQLGLSMARVMMGGMRWKWQRHVMTTMIVTAIKLVMQMVVVIIIIIIIITTVITVIVTVIVDPHFY
ncbi:hypothetical protein AK812_SmicGene13041 [Symbiodinium microadriaticum]|uniref:Uncharacterized protein n=1 Tax=Symbiodinium microadriaticum TaxID=2951 RepID=A0A1Q9E955_SYMMI|nr:hypothetical protein AK812_SmicGene13041 [Symbiodinium microadriaticum]